MAQVSNTIQMMAQDFSVGALKEIADSAELRMKIICDSEPKPWKRTKEENDAIDTFRKLAFFARQVIKMAQVKKLNAEQERRRVRRSFERLALYGGRQWVI